MRTQLDVSSDRMDDDERSFVAQIREHGWFRTEVFADEEGSGFSYTTGFWQRTRQPEVIMFGMSTDTAHSVFWDLFDEAQAGRQLTPGKRSASVFANLPAYAFCIAKRYYADFLGWNRWFYLGDDFPCLQIVWPDRNGLFPWESGFAGDLEGKQPDLTERGWLNEIDD